MITIEQIKQLRQETDVSYIECKKALEQVNGDIEQAKEILRKWGRDLAGKKSNREVNNGIIESYIHPNKKIGALIEIRCETDFVAKSEQFQTLAHEICLQITASNPLFLKEEDIPKNILDKEEKICHEQIKGSGKPEEIINQIIQGKIKKYKQRVCLLSQNYIKDESKTISDVINKYVAKLGENIAVKKFTRYEI